MFLGDNVDQEEKAHECHASVERKAKLSPCFTKLSLKCYILHVF